MKKIFLIISFGLLIVPAFAKIDSYVKAGLGLGYDSNVFLDQLGTGQGFAQAQFSTELKSQGQEFQVLGRADAQLELYSLFNTLNIRAGSGFRWHPSIYSLIKGWANFQYYMGLNYSLQAMAEYEQDLGDIATTRFGYEYNRSWGLDIITNENIQNHEAWIGVNLDINYRLYLDLEAGWSDSIYQDIMTPTGALHSSLWQTTVKANLIPGPLFNMEIRYNYLYNIVNMDTVIIVSSTNLLYTYNNADIHKLSVKFTYDAGIRTSLYSQVEKEWVSLTSSAQTESRWGIMAGITYFLNPSWKLEIPVTWDIVDSDIGGQYQRVRSSAQLYYLW